MPLSKINTRSTDTRLVQNGNMVYKVKFSTKDGADLSTVCKEEQTNKELEDVLRGVFYLDQREGPLKSIFTEHFEVEVEKKFWKIADKICFQQNGKKLKNGNYFFEFIVAARNIPEVKENSNLSDECEEKEKNISDEDVEKNSSSDVVKTSDDSMQDSSGEWTPSDSSDVDWMRVNKGYKKNKKTTKQKSTKLKRSRKNMKDDSSDADEGMIQELQKKNKRTRPLKMSDSESKEELAQSKLEKKKGKYVRNNKKRKQRTKSEENSNVDNILGTSYREDRQKRIADTSLDASMSGSRRSRRLYNPSDGPMTELPSVLENDDQKENERSRKSERSRSAAQESDTSSIKPKYTSLDALAGEKTSKRVSLRSVKVDTINQKIDEKGESNKEEIIQTEKRRTRSIVSCVRLEELQESSKMISPSKVAKTSQNEGKKSPVCLNKDQNSEKQKLMQSLRSPVARLQNNSRQLRSQSNSPVKRLQSNSRRSRFGSSSPVKNNRTRLSLRSTSHSSTPKRMAYTTEKESCLSEESGRLRRMRSSLPKKSTQKVNLASKDRHVVEREELEEVLKLQELAKSEPLPESCKRSAPKRDSTGMWDMLDSVLTPVVKLFKPRRKSEH